MMIMKFVRRSAAAFAGALALAFVFAGPAKAIPVEVELALLIDGSGSILPGEFALQINAYVAVLSDATVLPADGRATIGIWQFSTGVQQELALLNIASEADRTTLINALAMIQLGGWTAIGDAINAAAAALIGLGNAGSGTINQIIDVSTDGFSNVGANPNTAAAAAVGAGIEQVNCLGIGSSFNCGFIAGAGSFAVSAASFADFQTVLELKIRSELGTTIPEPTTLALLGAGLAGLAGFAFFRRRPRAA